MSKELNKAPVEQAEPASCQGTNCGTTTGDHSSECLAEAAASQGWELKPGDLCGRDCPVHPASGEQAGGERWDALQSIMEWTAAENIPDDRKLCLIRNAARASLEQPSPAQARSTWPKLEKPAQVGGVRFSAGVSSRLVVEAAQRLYEFESTPEKEAERIERLQAFREQCFEPLGAEFSKVLSENLVELSSDAKPEQADEKPGDSILCYGCFAKGVGPDHFDEAGKCLAAQAEAERPEVAEVAFVLRNIGAMDAEDIDGDNVDLRFEDAEGRDTGCDVSIVEYAEKAADLFEQHDRIVGALRAKIAQLRQHKNDYMDAGQETYRALQNEIREREAEIARLDGLVSGRTAERDAALARVAELERELRDEENAHITTIEQRDNAEHWADQLAKAIAERFGVDIGEHSNLNCPWNEALVWMQQPPTQAQHSVPEEFIGRLSEFLAQRGATGKALLRELRALCAALPGKEVGHE
ncbi:hypothetical protein ACNH7Y_005771 [Pseudomonas aeruginosa]